MENRKFEFILDQPRQTGLMAAYFPVNDPAVPKERLSAYETAQVDVVELGIKTSNPYADGEIVATSMRRSTGEGTIREASEAISVVRNFDHNAFGMIFGYAERKLTNSSDDWQNVDGLLYIS